MKRWLLLVLISFPGAAFAACEARVADAQAQIEASLDASLTARERAEIMAVLFRLCEPRQPGASVYEDDNRTARTTHGLNPRTRRAAQDETAAIIAVEIDGRRRGGDSRKAE